VLRQTWTVPTHYISATGWITRKWKYYVTSAEKYKEVCWIRKHNSPRDVWRWFIHGTSMALIVAHFCNFFFAKLHTKKQNTEGQKPHNSVYTYLFKVYISLQNIYLVDKPWICSGYRQIKFSSSLCLNKMSYIG